MPQSNITGDQRALAETLAEQLTHYRGKNDQLAARYAGTHFAEQYNIAIPPAMQNLRAVLGWYGIVVDTLEERLDFVGFNDPNDLGLKDVYTSNALGVEASMVHHDALLFGTGFVVVGTGYAGEPSPLVTMESPNRITGVWDRRLRRLSSAFGVADDGESARLYLPNATISLALSRETGKWVQTSVDDHGMGRVPVVRFDNRLRSNGKGQSEITPAVEYLTDAAARTILRMEVTSELYQAPKEVILGGDADLLTDEDGKPVSQWTTYMGRSRQIPWSNDDEQRATPSIVQLQPVDPKPFIDQVSLFGTYLASQSGFPSSYLGNLTNVAQTADAIVAGEVRLIKRAERRQTLFGQQWREVAYLSLLAKGGVDVEAFADVSAQWLDASTPTRAATTDAVVKLVQSGILAPDSAVVADELNLTPAQRATLERERTQSRASSALSAILDRRASLAQEGTEIE